MPSDTWWGDFQLDVECWCIWQVGPTDLSIQRLEREWRVAWRSSNDPLATGLHLQANTHQQPTWTPRQEYRFAQGQTDSLLIVSPILPDRSVVSRPDKPFLVLPGEQVTAYVSVPLWMSLRTGSARKALMDVPLFRPSAMWFGPPTDEGERCYAMRTRLLLQRAAIQQRPHRAITTAHLHNTASTPLTVTHLRIPVPNLPLFVSDGGDLWTAAINIHWSGEGDMAKVSIESGAPGCDNAQRLVEPREASHSNLLLRSFNSVFGVL